MRGKEERGIKVERGRERSFLENNLVIAIKGVWVGRWVSGLVGGCLDTEREDMPLFVWLPCGLGAVVILSRVH